MFNNITSVSLTVPQFDFLDEYSNNEISVCQNRNAIALPNISDNDITGETIIVD